MPRPACAIPDCRRRPAGRADKCDAHREHLPLPVALPQDLPISYRQLDHWARKGYLRPVRPRWGSGIDRHWPDDEIAVARGMARLVLAGLDVRVAARAAREAIESGQAVISLRGGVWLALTTDAHAPTLAVAASGG